MPPRKPRVYKITKRKLVAGATATIIAWAGMFGLGHHIGKTHFHKEPIQISRQASLQDKEIRMQAKSIKKPAIEKKSKVRQIAPEFNQTRVYRKGLSGKALAKAYGVKFTRSWRFDASPELIHDIKVLIVRECEKYNKPNPFNPEGKQMVDPYQIYTVFWKETHFNPNAIGAAGEMGIGQLKKSKIADLNDNKVMGKRTLKITDPFDLHQSIAGNVRHFVWLKENLETDTIFRRYAAHNQGFGAANNKAHKNWAKGNGYANDSWRLHQEFVAKKGFEEYT